MPWQCHTIASIWPLGLNPLQKVCGLVLMGGIRGLEDWSERLDRACHARAVFNDWYASQLPDSPCHCSSTWPSLTSEGAAWKLFCLLIDGGLAININASKQHYQCSQRLQLWWGRTSKFFGGLHPTADTLKRVWSITSMISQLMQGKKYFNVLLMLNPQILPLNQVRTHSYYWHPNWQNCRRRCHPRWVHQ